MSLILSIDTATDVGSVALHDKGKPVVDLNLFVEKGHSKSIAKMVEDTIEYAGVSKSELAAIAISKGPGSYTGLRIGTSLAKGLCYGLGIPLIGINTLEALAWQVHLNHSGSWLCPMIDARRMEVYCLLKDQNFQTIENTNNVILDGQSFSEYLQREKICFFGNGSNKFADVMVNEPNAIFLEDIYPSAKYIGELAYRRFVDQEFEDLAYFEPFYLKEFIAGKPKKLV